MWKRFFALILAAVMLCGSLCLPAFAQEAQKVELKITGTGYGSFGFLTDGSIAVYKSSAGGCSLKLESQEAFDSLYLMFDLECDPYTIHDDVDDITLDAGQYRMLHEFVQLQQPTTVVTITFPTKVRLSEISAYSPGEVPEDVQVWQPPLEGNTDILLLATHGDDDQLYFAGLFPLYAGERNYRVQVAYLTDHRNITNVRTHEMLNGLWKTGVTAYPVFADFDDFRIDDKQATYDYFAKLGTTKEELLGYVLEQLRRFDPMVVVGHDFAGEYGHGMHQVYADLLVQALEISNDASAYPELAEKYGVWDVPKTYIHLYEENPIVIDYDTPLESFEGLTAFQVTQAYGFPSHVSQQNTMFYKWIYGRNGEITKASQIQEYNPSQFGLYRSTVGADVQKNDFMENVICYAEQERLEAERLEAERLEAERLEAERKEAERLEAERLEKEKQEQEALRQQQEQQKAQEQLAKAQAQKKLVLMICMIGAGVLVLVLILVLVLGKRKKRYVGKYGKK